MKRTMGVLILLILTALLSACADTASKPDSASDVSTIPWNRPEKWEGGGGLGGFMPQQR